MEITKQLVDNILKIIPEFEYQFGRPMKLATQKELTNYQSKVLSVLQVVPKISMSDLADRLVMAKPQLTANVDVLFNLGLVERIADPQDRRKIIIRQTEAGKKYIDDTKGRMRAYYSQYYCNLSDNETKQLLDSMESLLVILEKLNLLSQGAVITSEGAKHNT